MQSVRIAAFALISAFIVSGQAYARSPEHHGPKHQHICKTEKTKTKVHGKWVSKTVKICR